MRESNGESSSGDGDAETCVVMSRLSESSIGVVDGDAGMVWVDGERLASSSVTSGIDGEREAVGSAGVADGLNESGDGE